MHYRKSLSKRRFLSFVVAALPAAAATTILFEHSPAHAAATFSQSTVVAGENYNGHKAKVVGKFSSDSDNDIGVINSGDGFYLYRGTENFATAHKISTFGNGSEEANVADVNGDGWNDIVIGGLDGTTVWLQNPGSNQYSTTWATHTVSTGQESHDCLPADMNNDGKIDIVTTFGIFFQGATPDSWSFTPITGKPDQGTSVVNMLGNGDGYNDIVGEHLNADNTEDLGWYENPGHTGGSPTSSSWTFHSVAHDPGGASINNGHSGYYGHADMSTAIGDFNKDGRPDIAMCYMYSPSPTFNPGLNTTPGDGLVWYACPSNPRAGSWTKTVIAGGVCFVHQDTLKVADFDGDGNLDIAWAEQEQSSTRNDGVTPTRRVGVSYSSSLGASWSTTLISGYPSTGTNPLASGGHNSKIGNIGMDSRPSLLVGNHGYFHTTSPALPDITSKVFLDRNTTTGTNHALPFIKNTAAYIPGTVQAEDYDNGGEAVGYHDADVTNNGSGYRADGVDIEHTTDAGGGYDVGWINSGEWTAYTVNVSSAGTYTINARVASTGTGSFHLVFGTVGSTTGGTSTPEFNVTSTGGGQNWTSISVAATLTAGIQWMRLVNDSGTGVYNLNYFSITPGAGGGSLSATTGAGPGTYNLTSLGASDWKKWAVGTGGGHSANTYHKSTGGSQISDYSQVNPTGGSYDTWNDTGISASWTDGTPGNITGDGGFLWENADATSGNRGWSFTAPADTTTRTLTVITGGNNVITGITAHLSDNSASDYVNSQTYGSTTGHTVYTITYHAAVAGATLQITLLKTGNNGATNGSVNLYGAYLTTGGGSAPAAPTGLGATAGAGQVTLNWTGSVGATSYNIYRGITAGGESGTPISTGVGTTSFIDTTVTNGITYYYKVAAVNGSGTSGFSNEASATPTSGVSGSLTGSEVTASTGIYALTTLGTTDWAYWSDTGGGAPYIHKSAGGSKISDVTKVGGTSYGQWHSTARNVSWTDGTPTASNTDAQNYIWNNGTTGQGWSFTVPAGTGVQTLNVLCGTSAAVKAMKLVAHLSDSSAADYVSTLTSSATVNTYLYTITYNAASASKLLTITLTNNDTQGTLSTDLMAAWLH